MSMILSPEEKQAFARQLVSLRQQLHRNPELSSREIKTTALLRERLTAMGLELLDLGLPTGAAALLRGGRPGPTIGIRADIDALPLVEKTDVVCRSQNPGIMHACGHDVHTTALLGAAELLCRQREELRGQVLFLFQPAEETVQGAESVIASGLFEKYAPVGLICLHVWPQLPAMQVGLASGAFLSAVDSFKITITGRGGHGSMPNESVNPIPAGSAVALAAPGIVSYDLPPAETAALSICSIQAGLCDNAIPDVCTLLGTARTFSEQSQQIVLRRLKELSENTAAAYGCRGELYIDHSIPPVVNDAVLSHLMGRSAEAVLGKGACRHLEQVMISEDFAYYGRQLPVCCALFGVGTGGKLHSASFYPPDDVLLPAASFLAECAVEILTDKAVLCVKEEASA